MTEGTAWRPVRHMNLNIIGARIEIRQPTVDGHLTLTKPFIVHTLHVEAGQTLGGWPLFETVRINDELGIPEPRVTAYDGDEYREIPN